MFSEYSQHAQKFSSSASCFTQCRCFTTLKKVVHRNEDPKNETYILLLVFMLRNPQVKPLKFCIFLWKTLFPLFFRVWSFRHHPYDSDCFVIKHSSFILFSGKFSFDLKKALRTWVLCLVRHMWILIMRFNIVFRREWRRSAACVRSATKLSLESFEEPFYIFIMDHCFMIWILDSFNSLNHWRMPLDSFGAVYEWNKECF